MMECPTSQEELKLVGVDEESLMTSEEGDEHLGRIWLVMRWRVGGGEGGGGRLQRQNSLGQILLHGLCNPSVKFHCLDPRIFPWYLSRILKFI